ncbi:MAG: glycosyltransferase family 2 protein [Gammaproteobacteria bacterium]|nr:glycosyltransferase family 2 protein [Gammaproteobacteria bacterium]
MLNSKKVVVVMPAYNAESTLSSTYNEIPKDIVDEVILVDDSSTDRTADVARSIGIEHVHVHKTNRGYGGNQKTCYQEALNLGADIVIMVHPDYQYTPKLITAMSSLISEGLFDCVLGSRILGVGALKGGMPMHKYLANRLLTFMQNVFAGYKLSEYHTGYRAFSKEVLEGINLEKNSDDFIFDNQMLLQIIGNGYYIGEVTCPTLYAEESSSIAGWKLFKYGVGVLYETLVFRMAKMGLLKSTIYNV